MENPDLTELETELPLNIKDLILLANRSSEHCLILRKKYDGEEYKVTIKSDEIGVKEINIKLRSKERVIKGVNLWEPQ